MQTIQDSGRLIDTERNGKTVWLIRCVSGKEYQIEQATTPGVSRYMPSTTTYTFDGQDFPNLPAAVGHVANQFGLYVR